MSKLEHRRRWIVAAIVTAIPACTLAGLRVSWRGHGEGVRDWGRRPEGTDPWSLAIAAATASGPDGPDRLGVLTPNQYDLSATAAGSTVGARADGRLVTPGLPDEPSPIGAAQPPHPTWASPRRLSAEDASGPFPFRGLPEGRYDLSATISDHGAGTLLGGGQPELFVHARR